MEVAFAGDGTGLMRVTHPQAPAPGVGPRHASPVVVITADKSHTRVATGAADGEVRIWDFRGYPEHNGVLRRLSGQTCCLAFLAPGVLLTGSCEGELVCWEEVEEVWRDVPLSLPPALQGPPSSNPQRPLCAGAPEGWELRTGFTEQTGNASHSGGGVWGGGGMRGDGGGGSGGVRGGDGGVGSDGTNAAPSWPYLITARGSWLTVWSLRRAPHAPDWSARHVASRDMGGRVTAACLAPDLSTLIIGTDAGVHVADFLPTGLGTISDDQPRPDYLSFAPVSPTPPFAAAWHALPARDPWGPAHVAAPVSRPPPLSFPLTSVPLWAPQPPPQRNAILATSPPVPGNTLPGSPEVSLGSGIASAISHLWRSVCGNEALAQGFERGLARGQGGGSRHRGGWGGGDWCGSPTLDAGVGVGWGGGDWEGRGGRSRSHSRGREERGRYGRSRSPDRMPAAFADWQRRRAEVWGAWFGEEAGRAECPACRRSTLVQGSPDWVCAVRAPGLDATRLGNLRPVCPACAAGPAGGAE